MLPLMYIIFGRMAHDALVQLRCDSKCSQVFAVLLQSWCNLTLPSDDTPSNITIMNNSKLCGTVPSCLTDRLDGFGGTSILSPLNPSPGAGYCDSTPPVCSPTSGCAWVLSLIQTFLLLANPYSIWCISASHLTWRALMHPLLDLENPVSAVSFSFEGVACSSLDAY